jgi:sulfide:quinone oxidoreductase
MSGKTILILGGGVGGIVTANALRERLASEHRIIIVDKRAEYIFTPSLLWVMAGLRQPEQITKDLRHMLQSGIEIVQAEVQNIDPERAIVRTNGDDLAYDHLVVTLGADLAPEVMPGTLKPPTTFLTWKELPSCGRRCNALREGGWPYWFRQCLSSVRPPLTRQPC